MQENDNDSDNQNDNDNDSDNANNNNKIIITTITLITIIKKNNSRDKMATGSNSGTRSSKKVFNEQEKTF